MCQLSHYSNSLLLLIYLVIFILCVVANLYIEIISCDYDVLEQSSTITVPFIFLHLSYCDMSSFAFSVGNDDDDEEDSSEGAHTVAPNQEQKHIQTARTASVGTYDHHLFISWHNMAVRFDVE